jgi:hypothetical protein
MVLGAVYYLAARRASLPENIIKHPRTGMISHGRACRWNYLINSAAGTPINITAQTRIARPCGRPINTDPVGSERVRRHSHHRACSARRAASPAVPALSGPGPHHACDWQKFPVVRQQLPLQSVFEIRLECHRGAARGNERPSRWPEPWRHIQWSERDRDDLCRTIFPLA